ncbi:lactonase family protein [Granulicella aggregans]|nr:beta-propeller fold lactonase family protein [Granulicella aggregans]
MDRQVQECGPVAKGLTAQMSSKASFLRMYGALAVLAGLACMTGCSGFFPPLSSGSGSGSGTTTGNFVYVASSFTSTSSGTSSVYSITGFAIGSAALTAISGATESLLFAPQTLAVTPTNSYLYVAGSGVIYGYAINATTGALTQVLTATSGQALANANMVSMVVSPDGKWLLGLDVNQSAVVIDEFGIDTSTGLLTLEAGATQALTSGATIVASNLAISPKGDYLAASLGTGGLVDFTFATGTGLVTPAGQLTALTSSSADQAAVFDSTSSTLYVAVSGTNAGVYPYTIGSGGALTQVSGAPFSLGTGDTIPGPASILIDKTGKYLYVGNRTAGSISGFSIATGGVLTALSGSPYVAGTTVTALGYDSTGDYLLSTASGGSPDLEMFSFDATTAGKLDTSTTASTGDPTEPAGAVAIALTH